MVGVRGNGAGTQDSGVWAGEVGITRVVRERGEMISSTTAAWGWGFWSVREGTETPLFTRSGRQLVAGSSVAGWGVETWPCRGGAVGVFLAGGVGRGL